MTETEKKPVFFDRLISPMFLFYVHFKYPMV